MSKTNVALVNNPPLKQAVIDQSVAEASPKRRRNPAPIVGGAILIILVSLAWWYPATDRSAPFASGASVMASVTQIAARVSGPVVAVLVRDNAQVKAGQALFRLDPSTFEMDVQQARAQFALATQAVEASSSAIEAAEAQVQRAAVALRTAEEERARTSALLERGVVSVVQANAADAGYDSALANWQAADAEVTRLKAQVGPGGADNPQVLAAQIGLEKAEFALENTTVVAPADGYITNLSMAAGQFATAGQPALTFINPSTQAVIGDFRENQLVNVAPGDKVEVVFQAAPSAIFTGQVESVAWGISSGRASVDGLAQSNTDTRWFPPARKIPVRVILDPDQPLPRNLRQGSEASILIYAEGEGGLVSSLSHSFLRLSSWMSGFN